MSLDDDIKLPEWIFRAAVGLLAAFVVLTVAFALPGSQNQVAATAPPAPLSDRATLLVIESASCGWCRRFREAVAPTYERSHLESRAPLKYIDVGQQRQSGYRLKRHVTATPTFVLVDRQGAEVDRLRGLPGGRDAFNSAVEDMLRRLAARDGI